MTHAIQLVGGFPNLGAHSIGYALGPSGIDLLRLDIAADAHLLRTITEIALRGQHRARKRVRFNSKLSMAPPPRWTTMVRQDTCMTFRRSSSRMFNVTSAAGCMAGSVVPQGTGQHTEAKTRHF